MYLCTFTSVAEKDTELLFLWSREKNLPGVFLLLLFFSQSHRPQRLVVRFKPARVALCLLGCLRHAPDRRLGREILAPPPWLRTTLAQWEDPVRGSSFSLLQWFIWGTTAGKKRRNIFCSTRKRHLMRHWPKHTCTYCTDRTAQRSQKLCRRNGVKGVATPFFSPTFHRSSFFLVVHICLKSDVYNVNLMFSLKCSELLTLLSQ